MKAIGHSQNFSNGFIEEFITALEQLCLLPGMTGHTTRSVIRHNLKRNRQLAQNKNDSTGTEAIVIFES